MDKPATLPITMKRTSALIVDSVLRAAFAGRGARVHRLTLRDKIGKVWPDLAPDYEGPRLPEGKVPASGAIEVTRQELEAVKMGILSLMQGDNSNGMDDTHCRRAARVFGLWEKHVVPHLRPDDVVELSGDLDFEEDILDSARPEDV